MYKNLNELRLQSMKHVKNEIDTIEIIFVHWCITVSVMLTQQIQNNGNTILKTLDSSDEEHVQFR